MFRLLPVALIAGLGTGCATVDYVGEAYPPTAQVDVFFAEKDVPRAYKVIGQVIASGDQFVSASTLNQKMLARARATGADGVIIIDITRTPMASTTDVTETTTISDDADGKTIKRTASASEPAMHDEIKAMFIRYK